MKKKRQVKILFILIIVVFVYIYFSRLKRNITNLELKLNSLYIQK